MKLTPEIIIETEAKYRNVERVWKEGCLGDGIAVPLIDTGVDPSALPSGAVASSVDLTPDRDHRDYRGHGTLMARYILGMAPKARIISVKVFGKSSAPTREDLVRALDYCATLDPKPKFVNCSLQIGRKPLPGITLCSLKRQCVLCQQVNLLWTREIAVVAAAGNYSSDADSFTCPANARWAMKVQSLENAEGGEPDDDVDQDLLGTSQAAALLSGCLALLCAAFPNKPGNELAALYFYLGIAINTDGPEVLAELLNARFVQKTALGNVYRTYVLLSQEARAPNSVDIEKSLFFTKELVRKLRDGATLEDLLNTFALARRYDESNYLAWLAGSKMLKTVLRNDKAAEEALTRCNELLPPREAFERQKVFGGRA